MNTMHEWIIIVILISSPVALALLWKNSRRFRFKRRLRKEVLDLIHEKLSCLEHVRLLGVGNVGAVVRAGLSNGWERQLGISWKGSSDIPSRVAIKFALFRSPGERMAVLTNLASEMDRSILSGDLPAICPLVALGRFPRPSGNSEYIVQLMPHIEGENLSDKLSRDRLDLEYALGELISTMETVLYLENRGFYSRNVDAENLIVTPGGKWIRIDFDNAVRPGRFPLRRMIRLARLCAGVLDKVDDRGKNETFRKILERIRVTERAPLKSESGLDRKDLEQKGILTSPRSLMDLLETISNPS